MIIYFVKETGEIVGTTLGRVHDESTLQNGFILPSGYEKEQIGKYVVPFKNVYRDEEQDVTELRVIDDVTKRVGQVVIGKKLVSVPAGMQPDVSFAQLILDVEEGKQDIYAHKVVIDQNGEVVDIVKK